MSKLKHIPRDQVMETLNQLYSDPLTGFVGRDKLFKKVQERYTGILYVDVEEFLKRNPTAQRHARPPSKQIVVQPIKSSSTNERWQMDLVDMGDAMAWRNHGFRYILTVIDHYSKYAWAYPLKNKSAKTVSNNMEALLSVYKPKILQSDNGTEFKNEYFDALSKQYSFQQLFSSAYHPQSQGLVERFNQTLKGLIHKYMTNAHTQVWAAVLPKLLENYNNSIHSTTGFKPIDVFNNKVKSMQKHRMLISEVKQSYKVNDIVRVLVTTNDAFTKKYQTNWSNHTYTIIKVTKGPQPRYTLQRDDKHEILRTYFHHQLKLANDVIEPIVNRVQDPKFTREDQALRRKSI